MPFVIVGTMPRGVISPIPLKSQAGRNPDWDFVIENSGSVKDLRERARELWEEIV